ncbi:MAG: hypothetical protein V4801_10400 [Burkholderia gladioli]
MRLLVDVPTGAMSSYRLKRYGGKRITYESTQQIETRVFAIRRKLAGERNSASVVEVEAFIPEHLRGCVPASDARWVRAGILRTTASIYANRKSLAPLLDSGQFEMRFDGDAAAA